MSKPFINRQKASSHTMPPGGIYVGIVKSVFQDGTVTVFIPRLGINYGPLRIAGQSPMAKIQVNQQVVCGFLNSGVTEIVVLSTLDSSPLVVSVSEDMSESAVDIYATPIDSYKVIKFSAVFSNLYYGSESIVFKELAVLIDKVTSPYLVTMSTFGTEVPFLGITLDIRIENGILYITCQTGRDGLTNVTTTRLYAL